MKQFLGVYILLTIFALPLFAFGSKDKKEENTPLQPVTVIGQIALYGNEPNTWLGFVDQKGVAYTLKVPAELLENLLRQQGVLLKLSGALKLVSEDQPASFQVLSGGTIIVEKFQPYELAC